MKEIILHIGCEKTGSTAIQHWLASNREYIRSQGFYYPKSPGSTNHTRLAIYSCNEDKGLERFLKNQELGSFRSEFADAFVSEVMSAQEQKILLSNEWLHPRIVRIDEFERLSALLRTVVPKITILLYVRPQAHLAMSLYSTALKSGRHHEFRFPAAPAGALPRYFNFYQIVRDWHTHFRPEALNLRVYEQGALVGSDIVRDYAEVIGLQLPSGAVGPRSNESLSDDGVMLMRAANYFIAENCVESSMAKHLRDVIGANFKGSAQLATDDEINNFQARFVEVNRDLRRLYQEITGSDIELDF